jgi:hypothetical protein
MGVEAMGGNDASWVISRGDVWAYGRVEGASVQSVVNGTDMRKNEARI